MSVIFKNILIKGFGKIKNMELKPEEGFNVIYGDNESGKSTIQWFIRGMFYGLRGGREKDGVLPPLKFFNPWNYDKYGGSIEYSIKGGEIYTVIRDFVDNSVTVLDSTFNDITNTFEIARDKSNKFAEIHLGLSEACFEKSVFVKQMDVKVDGSGKEDILSKIINASETGFDDISFKKAQKALQDALITNVGTDKTYIRPLDKINDSLKEMKDEFKKIEEKRLMVLDVEENLNNSINLLKEYENQRDLLNNLIEIIDILKIIDENEKIRIELQEINKEILKMHNNEMQKSGDLKDNISELNLEYESCKTKMLNFNTVYNKKLKVKKVINYSFVTAAATMLISIIISILIKSGSAKSVFKNTVFLKNFFLPIGIISFASSVTLILVKENITKKIKTLLNEKSNHEKYYELINEKLEKLKIQNNSLYNTIDPIKYLIRRASDLTGTNITYSEPNNTIDIINLINKDKDKIYIQNLELIKDVKAGIKELNSAFKGINRNDKWLETLSSIINKKCIDSRSKDLDADTYNNLNNNTDIGTDAGKDTNIDIGKNIDTNIDTNIGTNIHTQNDDMKINGIESEVINKRESINNEIHNLVLKVKEYETIIATSGYNNCKLQEIIENIQDLEEKKDKLLKLRF